MAPVSMTLNDLQARFQGTTVQTVITACTVVQAVV